ncbi:MAG: hypothetical protein ACYSO3_10140, partial [Planctomycetota bacterium]
LFGISCRKTTPNDTGGRPSGPVAVSSGEYLSRQDIQKQLAVIAKMPPPKELAYGAMCYEVVAPPSRIDYVCPDCGEKTLYAVDTSNNEQTHQSHWKTVQAIESLEQCRRLVLQIEKLDVTLHESAFCKQCAPEIKTPHLDLIILYPDVTKGTIISDVNQTDLLMLIGFLDGKLKYKGLQDQEQALKDCMLRLQELLGVELDDTK